jgi:hypothetical protein
MKPLTACSLTISVAMALVAGLGVAADDPPHTADPAADPATDQAADGLVRVGCLIYADDGKPACFSEGFLTAVDRVTDIHVQRRLEWVELSSQDVFEYPFLVMAGEGSFELTAQGRANLKAYLERGGLLLASAGCSNRPWADSFRRELTELFPDVPLSPLPAEHPVFHTIYDIDKVRTRQAATGPAIFGLELAGRLAVIFSPVGLHDTVNAGEGCCCCGGNEVRDAMLVNANVLAYALTN